MSRAADGMETDFKMSEPDGSNIKLAVPDLIDRDPEKLHEDMLAKTELEFTYEVDGINLLQIESYKE